MYITQQLFLYFKVSSLNSGRCRIHTSFFPSEGRVASLLPFAQQRSLVAAHQTPHRNQTNTRQQSALEKKNSREIRLMRGLHSQRALEPSYSPLLWAQAFFLFFFLCAGTPCWLFKTEYPADEALWTRRGAQLLREITAPPAPHSPSYRRARLTFRDCRWRNARFRSRVDKCVCLFRAT